MGSELLDEEAAPPVRTFTEQFYEVFPFYLSIGMTYELFWLEDVNLVRYYRKAYEMQRERMNYDAWLQGAYFYDALCAVSPVLNAFAKKGTKPIPYLKEPYGKKEGHSGSDNDKPAKTEEEIREIQALNASAKFASFMTQWNKRFEQQKGGEKNGPDNRRTSNRDSGK